MTKRTEARITAINDFVIKFANVNGSGSASANELFAKSFLRMGIPVSPRNIFPSNIQGLPTWYEVRVTDKGYLGRRGGVDLMVAMNPQTWKQDVAEIEPGGYLFYDSTKVLPPSKFRDDINVIGLPLTEICNLNYSDSRERQLFKNIIYVGALAGLLGIEPEVIAELIGEQYKGKEKLLKPNLNAFQMGLNHAKAHLKDAMGLKVKRSYNVGDKVFIEGNAAAALGCVYGGATVCAWYPITPSSSLAEAFQKYCSKLRVDKETGKNKFAIIQAEDALMSEFIGLAYFAEIPAVIIDVQRGGPSTGMPTRTQQSDVLKCAYASHGDTKHVLLFPEDPYECFEFAAQCFDLAERLQTPVFMMSDLDIGMNQRLCKPLVWSDERTYDRGKVMTAEMLDAGKEFGRYLDVDGDGVPFRTYPGTHATKGAYFTRGTSKNAYAVYSEAGDDYVYNMQRLLKKHEHAKTLVPKPVLTPAKAPARFGCIYYGSTSPSMHEALESLSQNGIFVNALRVRAFPFQDEIFDFVQSHTKVFVIEQNRDAQLKTLLVNEAGINPASLISVLHYDGTPITARFIHKEISEIVAALNVRPIKKDKAA